MKKSVARIRFWLANAYGATVVGLLLVQGAALKGMDEA